MLYRKVFCKDRLPDNILKHDTSEGDAQYIKGRWEYLGFVLEYQPEWWFEEVKEPTEEEISEKAKRDLQYQSISVKVHHDVGFRIGFYSGYKQALKDLKGE